MKQLNALRTFWRTDLKFFRRLSLIGFVLLIAGTFILGLLQPAVPEKVMEFFGNYVAESGIVDEDGSFSAAGLFGNNARAMLVTICYGFIPFIYLPILSMCLNAALLGLFAAFYVASGQSLWVYLAGLLPHGIFELPAMVIATACGLYLCSLITDYVRHNPKGVVKPALWNIVRVFLIVVVPLLILAAVLEAYVTPSVMDYARQLFA